MDCDLLLSWMTHTGQGSWARFRSAVEELAGRDADLSNLRRSLRIVLSDLGFTDFFIEDSQQWRMLPPVLGGLSGQDGAAVLCGSRTPILVETLRTAAGSHGCEICVEKPQDCPTLIRMAGGADQLSEVAKQAGTSFEPNLARVLAQELTPIPEMLENPRKEAAPLNWKVRSFDFAACTWVDTLLPNSACEFTPRYGRPKYFLHRRRGRLLRASKRESLYAAAMFKGVRLIGYDPTAKELKVPLFAPLPESYSRAACLCLGRPTEVSDGQITYCGVPPDVAAVLAVAAGQPHPGVGSPAGTWR